MSHHQRGPRLSHPLFGWGPSISSAVAVLVLALVGHAASAAEDAGLAFVLGAGSHLALGSDEVALPEGARLELIVLGEREGGGYQVELRPGGLQLPAVSLGDSGQQLRVRIAGASPGWLSPSGAALGLELATTVEVEVGDDAQVATGAYALALSTDGGVAIDRGTCAGRLVAQGTIGPDSPVAPGEPLVVVLDGRFEGLPTDLR